MKMTFRWYGDDDPVSLEYIRQIPGMSGVVTAVYSVPVGEVWPEQDIVDLKNKVNAAGLEMEVIESVPVHEEVKLGRGDFQKYIDNYKENIRLLGKHGVKVICYNFMPVFDWTRSQLDHELEDGSTALVYYKEDVDKLDPTKLALPGWDSSYSPEEMTELIQAYKDLGEEGLWKNLEYFLSEIMPVAVESGIKMAIHPDDPPWPIFGIPRIITGAENLRRFLGLYDHVNNGLTLCAGSLGVTRNNDMVELVKEFASRVHFAHVRNVKIIDDEGSFEESAHLARCGSLDMVGIMKAYHDAGFTGYMRPDHGRMIWGETGKPGYGLYDRALGAQYLMGIWDALDQLNK